MKKFLACLLAATLLAGFLAGCGGTEAPTAAPEDTGDSTTGESTPEPDHTEEPDDAGDTAAAGDYVAPEYVIPEQYNKVLGQTPTSDRDITLTAEEEEAIRDGGFKIGLALHYGGNDWSTAFQAGVEDVCQEYGVELVAVADAGFDPVKQSSDIDNIMTLEPDAMIVIPAETNTMGASLKSITAAGIKLIVSESLPEDMTEDDFVAYATSSAYGNGVASAQVMAEALGGQGEVAVFHWNNTGEDMVNRHQGFIDYIEACVPGIEIVVIQEFEDPNKVSEVADAVLVQHPGLNGAWASWDVPAEGVMSAALSQGKDDSFTITTIDLGVNMARVMAEDGMIKGTGAQRPYFAGRVEAIVALKALIGGEVPQYIQVDGIQVDRHNLLEAWPEVFAYEAPDEIQRIVNG